MKRRTVLQAGLVIGAGLVLEGCKTPDERPRPTPTVTSSQTQAPVPPTPEGPPVIEIGRRAQSAALPAGVAAMVGATARTRMTGRNNGRPVRSADTAVRIGSNLWLSAGHGFRENDQPIDCMAVEAGVEVPGSGWQVVRMTGLATATDIFTDLALLRSETVPTGVARAVLDTSQGPYDVNQEVFIAGYPPPPGETRFTRPIDQSAPRAVFGARVLEDGPQLKVLAGFGNTYGDAAMRNVRTSSAGLSGGEVMTGRGVLGVVLSHDNVTVADINATYGVGIVRDGRPVADGTPFQVVTVNGINVPTIQALQAQVETISAC